MSFLFIRNWHGHTLFLRFWCRRKRPIALGRFAAAFICVSSSANIRYISVYSFAVQFSFRSVLLYPFHSYYAKHVFQFMSVARSFRAAFAPLQFRPFPRTLYSLVPDAFLNFDDHSFSVSYQNSTASCE